MNPSTPSHPCACAAPQSPGTAAPQAPAAPAGEALQVRRVSEGMLDEAVEATFPASDPVALVSTKAAPSGDGGHQPR